MPIRYTSGGQYEDSLFILLGSAIGGRRFGR